MWWEIQLVPWITTNKPQLYHKKQCSGMWINFDWSAFRSLRFRFTLSLDSSLVPPEHREPSHPRPRIAGSFATTTKNASLFHPTEAQPKFNKVEREWERKSPFVCCSLCLFFFSLSRSSASLGFSWGVLARQSHRGDPLHTLDGNSVLDILTKGNKGIAQWHVP